MEFSARRRLGMGAPLVVGDRNICVVSEEVLISSEKGAVFAILISPIALIVLEGSQQYALSLVEGSQVTLEDLISKEPSLREELSGDLFSMNGT